MQSDRLASHPRRPLFVGVFQNPTLATLISTIDELHLDAVQFHGSEPVEWARLVSVPVLRVFHVESSVEPGSEEETILREATRPGFHAAAVLDTAVGSGKGALSGGAGKTFDWGVARKLIESRGEGHDRLPVVLAGGLDASNVIGAIDQVQPWAIDVSGGVETNGTKDLEKIKEFVHLVKFGRSVAA
jgi:anthranilate synthase/indole-3-glycerol phosphate synthase/phosphoribosylanthranilate isomerase